MTTWTKPGRGRDRRDEADAGAGLSGLGSGANKSGSRFGGKEGISLPSCEASGFSGVLQSSS